MLFNLTHSQLKESEKSIFSQGGQDGVLEAIFNQIGEGDKSFCDIGARDGKEISNSGNLRIHKRWHGILIDSHPLAEDVIKEKVVRETVNLRIQFWCESSGYQVGLIDFLTIDIDGNDYWVWEAIGRKFRVVSIEFNSKFRNDESYAIEYNSDHKWEGDDYYGASLLALKKLGDKKGYTLVYVVDRYDAVFVRNDLISKDYIVPTLDELLPEPIIAHETKSTKKWVIV